MESVLCSTFHDQLAATVQRLSSCLGSTFVDGGIQPRFGTRNFTASLKNGQYIEVVCPLDYPAIEQTPLGKAVSKKAQEGSGWLTWVFSTEDISAIEEKFGRKAVDGHRTPPDGTDLKWKHIGVKEIEKLLSRIKINYPIHGFKLKSSAYLTMYAEGANKLVDFKVSFFSLMNRSTALLSVHSFIAYSSKIRIPPGTKRSQSCSSAK